MYRGSLLIVTCLAILAVDFRVFPRRFAKVETWGTSLMDLGVGSFVFSAGVVSARSILKPASVTGTKTISQEPSKIVHRLINASRHTLPLLALGLLRLYSVKNLDYAEHVTEYGVHWNFFFTLAFLPPFVELSHTLTAFIPIFPYETLSLLIGLTYQILLDSTTLTPYILISPREASLLSKNREGIFSFLGYLSVFLFGRSIGIVILSPPSHNTSSASAWQSRKQLLMSLFTRTALITTLFFLTNYPKFASVAVSRRLANLPYILWVIAFNTFQLTILCAVETFFFPHVYGDQGIEKAKLHSEAATSQLLRAYNANGLVVFLLANLLTGAVNLSTNTLDMKPLPAMGVLVAYAATVTAIAMGLDSWGLKIKL